MQEFQHIIITRFNLRNHQWSDRTKNNTPILTESWLEDRFDLFENFCYLSVRNQTNINFQWWVFFDTKTPTRFRERHKRIRTEIPSLHSAICGWDGYFFT